MYFPLQFLSSILKNCILNTAGFYGKSLSYLCNDYLTCSVCNKVCCLHSQLSTALFNSLWVQHIARMSRRFLPLSTDTCTQALAYTRYTSKFKAQNIGLFECAVPVVQWLSRESNTLKVPGSIPGRNTFVLVS